MADPVEPKKTVIAVCVWRNIEAACFASIQAAMMAGYPLMEHRNDALISRARSEVASQFLAFPPEFDQLLFVDSDIVFTLEDVEKVARVARERQCVAGAAYVTRRQGLPWPVVRPLEGGSIRYAQNEPPLPVQFVSGGFMCIPRSVLLKLAETLPCTTSGEGTGLWPFFLPMVKPWGDGTTEFLSEDWAFPVAPETPVLASDWQWRPLHAFQPGDTVLGMTRGRWQESHVESVIHRNLPALSIITEAGEITASAEHPWLVKRRPVGNHGHAQPIPNPGIWSWVPTSDLRPGDHLAQASPVVPAVEFSSDYMAGYIQGIWHGDGTSNGDNASLRMCDEEAIRRTLSFLPSIGVNAHPQPLSRLDNERHRPLYGVYVGKFTVPKLEALILAAAIPGPAFAAGYLAGIYDAEGNYDGATVSIHNRNPALLHRVCEAGQLLSFDFVVDDRRARLTGAETVQRFWSMVRPAIQRKMNLQGQSGQREIPHHPVKVLELGAIGKREVQCLTTSTGNFIAGGMISHNCQRAHDAGVEVWVDPTIDLGHVGVYEWHLKDAFQDEEYMPDLSSVVRDFAEYCEMTVEDALKLVKTTDATDRLALTWRSLQPESVEAVDAFYRGQEAYVLDLVRFNADLNYWRQVSPFLRLRGHVADFGGGIGSLALAMARRGMTVEYVDLPSPQRTFAEWRFKKHAAAIGCHEGLGDLTSLDGIVSTDTIEHLHPATLGQVAREMWAALKPGAVVRCLSKFGESDRWPMHFDSAAAFAEAMKTAGFVGESAFWQKPGR